MEAAFEGLNVYLEFALPQQQPQCYVLVSAMKSYKNKPKLLQCDFINTELKLCSYFEGVLVIKVLIFNKMPCQSEDACLYRKSDPFTHATSLCSHPPSTTSFKINTQELFTIE